jgi:hypothetical protein
MNKSLVICASCNCHLRAGEQRCPHCGADVAARGGLRSVERRRIEIRRILFTVAVAGASIVSCSSEPPDPRVAGSCATDSGGAQTLNCLTSCSCGDNGMCDPHGKCVACGCTTHQVCYPVETFGDQVARCSTRPCYGAPPVLA